jgi:DNA-binding NarL/FixJ family response regulator
VDARSEQRKVRVAVIGFEQMLSEALATRLSVEPWLIVLTEEHVDAVGPSVVAPVDVALVDASAEVFAGGASFAVAGPNGRSLPVLALTEHDDPAAAVEVIRRGASAFLSKSATATELIETLERLAAGDIRLPVQFLGEIIRESSAQHTERADLLRRLERLTVRERDVLALLVDGLDQEAIGKRLFISANTVRTHVRHLREKLGVRSQLEAMSLALRAGYRPSSEGAEADLSTKTTT